jgi:hypothetical protein
VFLPVTFWSFDRPVRFAIRRKKPRILVEEFRQRDQKPVTKSVLKSS